MQMIHPKLTLGQRYIQPGAVAGDPDQLVMVTGLDQDRFGVPRVTFRLPDGRHLSVFAEQIEAAIADGALTEVRSRKSEVAGNELRSA